MTDWGGYWTEVKLEVLRKYLVAFNTASTRAGATVYLDLFAGRLTNRRPDTGAKYRGSSALAMAVEPPFTQLVLWELNNAAEKLRTDLAATFPGDRRYAVIGGDCNTRLDTGLEFVRPLRWAPAFAFIDPRGLDVGWETLERLSRWRQDRKAGRKVELWILMAEPALERVLGLRGVQGQSSADRLSWLFGSDDWVAIHQHRRRELFSPQQTRAEFVNLYRWRLQKVLGYKRTHPLQFGNVSNHPVYTMIFATDDVTGDKIMADVYDRATMSEIPAMRSQAFEARR
ncbi:MAG: three-Cys-motif partner protein TcmP, partial [Actinomycetota bacterium]|nr:three-Cys-motif partner protein TcmP [Actinomycetota bacterium]